MAVLRQRALPVRHEPFPCLVSSVHAHGGSGSVDEQDGTDRVKSWSLTEL